jgi:hypothetical protein
VLKGEEKTGAITPEKKPCTQNSRTGDTLTQMDPRLIDLLKVVKVNGGLRGNTPEERATLDSLEREGYLKREDGEPPFPGGPIPAPVYRITVLGLAVLAGSEGI